MGTRIHKTVCNKPLCCVKVGVVWVESLEDAAHFPAADIAGDTPMGCFMMQDCQKSEFKNHLYRLYPGMKSGFGQNRIRDSLPQTTEYF